jgi:hypothetical protein
VGAPTEDPNDSFPYFGVENLSPSRQSISNSPVSRARVRVPIADDEPIIADTLEMILAEEGIDAISVYNGREAIDKENALTFGDQNPPRQRWGEQVSSVQIGSSSVLFGHCPERVAHSLRGACMGFVLAALRAESPQRPAPPIREAQSHLPTTMDSTAQLRRVGWP